MSANIFQKLKNKWGITSNFQCFIIILVFSLAGSSIGFVRKPIFFALGIQPHHPLWLKIVVYIPLIVPLYQFFLIFYGTLLGQFPFFWQKEKKLAKALYRLLQKVMPLGDSP